MVKNHSKFLSPIAGFCLYVSVLLALNLMTSNASSPAQESMVARAAFGRASDTESTLISIESGVVVKQDIIEELNNNKFRQSLLKAANSAAKKGEFRRIDVIKLRVATLSPAFVEKAQELAVIQMAFSGEDVPLDADGKIEVSRIDWEGLIVFLERLLPLIIKLIDLFASIDNGMSFEAVAVYTAPEVPAAIAFI